MLFSKILLRRAVASLRLQDSWRSSTKNIAVLVTSHRNIFITPTAAAARGGQGGWGSGVGWVAAMCP